MQLTPALRDPFALYQLLGPLRLDGVGTLECARSLSTGQRVCLRRVPNSAQAQAVVELALSLPRHDALAAGLDAGVWEDFAWLVSEFPEGKLLGDEPETAVGTHRLATEFAPVAEALGVLHQSARAHGLISGEALLVTESGRLMLHEAPLLEVNRATDRRPEQTALAQLQRTAPFFAPERLKGGQPTAAGDVYGLGVLIALLGGAARPPGQSALERVHALMVGSWTPAAPASFPAAFADLIQRMTHPDPAQRPAASEVGLRLLALGRVDDPALPAPVPTAPGAPSFVRPEPPRPSPPLLVPALPPHLAALAPAPAKSPRTISVTTQPAVEVVAAPVEPPAIPAPQPTAPYGGPAAAPVPITFAPPPTVEFPAAGLPAPAPTVPTLPPAWMLQSGGAQPVDLTPGKSPPPRPQAVVVQRGAWAALNHWASGITISIASSDAKLITAGLLALTMLASTVALGAHVLELRNDAQEQAVADALKPRPVKEPPKYNAEQLKQIMRQKEAAHREY